MWAIYIYMYILYFLTVRLLLSLLWLPLEVFNLVGVDSHGGNNFLMPDMSSFLTIRDINQQGIVWS